MRMAEQSAVRYSPLHGEGAVRRECEIQMKRAEKYFENSQFAQSIECYRKVIALVRKFAEPFVGMGMAQIQIGELSEAFDTFLIALKKDSRCPEAYKGLASIHQMRGNFEMSIQMYLRCLELDKDDLSALVGLFQSSCQMGRFDTIVGLLRDYLQRNPGDPSIMLCLATLFARQGEFAHAKQTLLSLLKLVPGHVKAAQILEEIEYYESVQFPQGESSYENRN